MDIKPIIKNLKNSRDLQQFLLCMEEKKFTYTTELLDLLKEAINKSNSSMLEFILIIASKDGLDLRYSSLLCDLLKDHWHEFHEDIVMMLEEIKDPNTVNCIYQAALDIPDYDDGRSLAKKSIWALGAINSDLANTKLHLLAKLTDSIIQQAALMQIEHNYNKK